MKFGIRTRGFILLASVLLLGACSAIKLGYNNSVTFAHTYLSNKIDFDDTQSALLRTSLTELVQWHRSNELPKLAQELQVVQTALTASNSKVEPVTTAQVQALNQTVRTSLRRTANQAAPLIAKNMLGFYPHQIPEIEAALKKSNEKYREERLPSNPDKRTEQSAERMAERFERWLGNLNKQQLALIDNWAKNRSNNPETWFQKRLERQQRFMVLANQAANRQIDQNTLSQQIAALLNDWQNPANASEKRESEMRQQATIALIVDVLNVADSKQRSNAAERAAGWAEDFQILASSN
ncbi:DUF6279 family lipoprotein [Limnobacter parvus]|uniref:DUF6279 family lipoprotein n=1 Tax=Limnobacter parvus TaxID=2939690 RepID=A0ABT1XNH0_9BURK|nr:DUF6279 family lipoprotein [Limnobacter parvus]MCR2747649.1 DUF6279 family lipoprotein [Limnobacter parvus]